MCSDHSGQTFSWNWIKAIKSMKIVFNWNVHLCYFILIYLIHIIFESNFEIFSNKNNNHEKFCDLCSGNLLQFGLMSLRGKITLDDHSDLFNRIVGIGILPPIEIFGDFQNSNCVSVLERVILGIWWGVEMKHKR